MSTPGANRHTQSQAAALNFLTLGESELQSFSTPAASRAHGIIEDFYLAEERWVDPEERRIE